MTFFAQADVRSGKIHQCHVSWMNLHKDENGMLIARKDNLAENEYETNLERLFIELAKVNRSIKQAGS